MQQVCNMNTVENFTTQQWVDWMNDKRCIHTHVIEQMNIRFSDRGVTIPIYDVKGKHLFNKYRRAPWIHEGPKYTYEKGATAQLYCAHMVRDVDTVYMTEGEFDTLVLYSLGYYAVSTTGGAGTFNPEWSKLLNGKKIVLCYDADSAGVNGALRIVDILGDAHIAFLPWGFGKDVTDVVSNKAEHKLRKALSRTLHITNKWKETLDILKAERVRYIQQYAESPIVVDMYIDGVHARIQENKVVKRASVPRDADKITRANTYPIQKLVKVNSMGFAHCVTGCKDKTASMKVYKDNHAFSFCCGKRHDAIGIYRTLHTESTFAEALDALI